MAELAFQFFPGTHVVFGRGTSKQVGEVLETRGLTKPLIVTDKGIVQAELLEGIKESLIAKQLEFVVFDEIPPNPPSLLIDKGVNIFKENGCDSLIAVGGGSPMDACKAISMMTTHDGSINDYDAVIGTKAFEKPGSPVITIPTTAGTGSEVTHWVVITNEETHRKQCIGSPYMAPAVALADPELLIGLPPHITAATGVDALTHAIEGYTSKLALNGASPATDALMLKAIRLISQHLRQAFAQGENYEAREKTMAGSLIAGMAFQNIGLGNTHALAHPLGGHKNIPHGVANAILLPYVMKFNLPACPERFAEVAKAMGENVEGLSTLHAAEKAVEAVKRLVKDLEIPTLSSFNIKEEDWELMVADALNDSNSFTNPRNTTAEQFLDIYQQANHD